MKRNIIIDIIKGSLIYLMVCNHSIDYFAIDKEIYKYFRFVTGIFIFVAGFISTYVYRKRTEQENLNRVVAKRLMVRGIKLIGLFIFVNIMISLILKHNIQNDNQLIGEISKNLSEMLVYGNYKVVDFSLLIPIGYLIVTMGITYLIFYNRWNVFQYIVVILTGYVSIRYFIMNEGFNFTHVLIGLIGAVCGNNYDKIREMLKNRTLLILVVYGIHLIIVSQIKMYFPVYLLSIICNFILLHAFGDFLEKYDGVHNIFCLTGKYTLFCYLYHIMVLQIIKAANLDSLYGFKLVVFAATITFLITFSSVYLLDISLRKSAVLKKIYTFVFA